MSPLTHLLVGWEIGRNFGGNARDRNLVAWSSVAPDLDALGLIVDGANSLLGRPPTHFYSAYHHELLHGLFGAICLSIIVAALAKQKAKTTALCFFVFHLHLICDLLGSRGPGPQDFWPIHYLAPLSQQLTFSWSGQWPLNGWPNIALTAALIVVVFRATARDGISPFLLVGSKANEAFVSLIRHRSA
jgi:inner membrane protein